MLRKFLALTILVFISILASGTALAIFDSTDTKYDTDGRWGLVVDLDKDELVIGDNSGNIYRHDYFTGELIESHNLDSITDESISRSRGVEKVDGNYYVYYPGSSSRYLFECDIDWNSCDLVADATSQTGRHGSPVDFFEIPWRDTEEAFYTVDYSGSQIVEITYPDFEINTFTRNDIRTSNRGPIEKHPNEEIYYQGEESSEIIEYDSDWNKKNSYSTDDSVHGLSFDARSENWWVSDSGSSLTQYEGPGEEPVEEFCDFRGPVNECIMNETNQLQEQEYNI